MSQAPKPCFGQFAGSQQNNPGCLHEERAQVTVAALGDAPEDGSVSSRHLLRHEAEPAE